MPEPLGKEFIRTRAALLKAWKHPGRSPPSFNPRGRSNLFTELMGEHLGLNKIDPAEYEILLHPEEKGTPHGFDTVLKEIKSGKIIVLEYKGMTAKLSDAQKNTREWIKQVTSDTIAGNGNYSGSTQKEIDICERVVKALAVGKVEFRVFHSTVDRKGRVKTKLKDRRALSSGTIDDIPLNEQAKGGPVRKSQSFEKLPQAPTEEFRVARQDIGKLRELQSRGLSPELGASASTKLKILRSFSKAAKVFGPALVVFDTMASYAQAADEWHAGKKSDAARTLSEFAGRTAGALVLGEALGLGFGAVGSVVPGLGTTIGALTGGIIGGVLGAGLGETGARALCDTIMQALQSQGSSRTSDDETAPSAPPNAGNSYPDVAPPAHVAPLYDMMLESGYGRPETNFVCMAVSAKLMTHQSEHAVQPREIFEGMISDLPPVGSTDTWADPRSPIHQYPQLELDHSSEIEPSRDRNEADVRVDPFESVAVTQVESDREPASQEANGVLVSTPAAETAERTDANAALDPPVDLPPSPGANEPLPPHVLSDAAPTTAVAEAETPSEATTTTEVEGSLVEPEPPNTAEPAYVSVVVDLLDDDTPSQASNDPPLAQAPPDAVPTAAEPETPFEATTTTEVGGSLVEPKPPDTAEPAYVTVVVDLLDDDAPSESSNDPPPAQAPPDAAPTATKPQTPSEATTTTEVRGALVGHDGVDLDPTDQPPPSHALDDPPPAQVSPESIPAVAAEPEGPVEPHVGTAVSGVLVDQQPADTVEQPRVGAVVSSEDQLPPQGSNDTPPVQVPPDAIATTNPEAENPTELTTSDDSRAALVDPQTSETVERPYDGAVPDLEDQAPAQAPSDPLRDVVADPDSQSAPTASTDVKGAIIDPQAAEAIERTPESLDPDPTDQPIPTVDAEPEKQSDPRTSMEVSGLVDPRGSETVERPHDGAVLDPADQPPPVRHDDPASNEYDAEGFNLHGFDRDGFDVNGYDEDGIDRDGFHADGYNAYGFDARGYDAKGYDAQGYNADGFDARENRSSDYDADGFDEKGYDRNGFDANGYDADGFDDRGYDARGYDVYGFDDEGVDARGNHSSDYDTDGFDADGFDTRGYDAQGYDTQGFDINGFDADGYDASGFDAQGFNAEGYDAQGYNADGYDADGHHSSDYDTDGFDTDGYDRDGFDAGGFNADGYDRSGFDPDGYDASGFDAQGYNAEGYDAHGYNADGLDADGHHSSDFDADGFNTDGYDGDGFDAEGFDANGYDRDGFDAGGYDANGYDRSGFDAQGYDLGHTDPNDDYNNDNTGNSDANADDHSDDDDESYA